ncbi:hypothetical protein ACQEVB_02730 [Pseudonocardia sp. CA-107938]|uniref:hypothetical protein n=1 Tax=Pseudonocardia sp. CA-107938 TaxID=3240021 RepID=UPI003D940723
MSPLSLLLTLAVLVWVMRRQFVGRFVSTRRSLTLPVVLGVFGAVTVAQAHVEWTAAALAWIAIDTAVTVVLGAVRGCATTLTLRDGYLYQRGGVPTLLLWLLSIGARVLVAVLAHGTSAGPAVEASLLLTFGISLGVQALVLLARVRADGRPVHPGVGRRAERAPSTLSG